MWSSRIVPKILEGEAVCLLRLRRGRCLRALPLNGLVKRAAVRGRTRVVHAYGCRRWKRKVSWRLQLRRFCFGAVERVESLIQASPCRRHHHRWRFSALSLRNCHPHQGPLYVASDCVELKPWTSTSKWIFTSPSLDIQTLTAHSQSFRWA